MANIKQQATRKGITATYRTKKESNATLAEVAGWVQKVANKKQQATSKGITATYRTKKELNAATRKQKAKQGHDFRQP